MKSNYIELNCRYMIHIEENQLNKFKSILV